jgi:hypothetical protein
MKHFTSLSKGTPAKAQFQHPGLIESLVGLITAPIATIAFHIDYIGDKLTGNDGDDQ